MQDSSRLSLSADKADKRPSFPPRVPCTFPLLRSQTIDQQRSQVGMTIATDQRSEATVDRSHAGLISDTSPVVDISTFAKEAACRRLSGTCIGS